MRSKEAIATLGVWLLGITVLLAGLGLFVAFYFGAAWASEKLLPTFAAVSQVAVVVVVLILLPLTIPRPTRAYACVALYVTSFLFGVTLWMAGLLMTLSLWGMGWAIVGLLMGGVGVVPMGMLATLFNGEWPHFFDLIVLAILTFGSRAGALAIAERLDSARREPTPAAGPEDRPHEGTP